MGILSYISAVVLIIAWAIGYIIYDLRGIHVLPVIAFAAVIQQVIQSSRFSNQLFRLAPSNRRASKIQFDSATLI
jgi:hypothetical protein